MAINKLLQRGTAAALVVMFVVSAHVVAQPVPPDLRFGIVESFVNPAAASEAGAGFTRIVLYWDVIQPTGPDDWMPANVPDPLIQAEVDAGREVTAILISTPAWASASGGDARSMPDMNHWRAFVGRMAAQYRGRIDHWIIWNEPDVFLPGHPGHNWNGSVEDYYLLLKNAYQAIKEVDPEIQVGIAGLTYYWDSEYGRRQYLARLLEVVAADPEAAENDFFFDFINYHLYFNPWQTDSVLKETRALLSQYGLGGKAIWVAETNAPPSDDSAELPWSQPRFQISLDEQAAYVIQEFALAFAAGAERVQIYKLRNSADHPESIEPFGLLRADDSRRPAFTAYQVAARFLRDFTQVYRQALGPVQAVTFERGAETTTVLWNTGRAATQARVRAIASEAVVVDPGGNEQILTAADGIYTLDLPGCTQAACTIGGAPRLLVERGAAQGRAALISPPTPVPTFTPTTTSTSPAPTPSPTPSPTASPTASPTPTPTSTSSPQATPTLLPPIPTPAPEVAPVSSTSRCLSPVLISLPLLIVAGGWATWRRRF
ncbi:MAG: hypothetical protein J5I90_04080 [Caldilineales bacterium]|nr:hypothetical protein [Caldilineales bacterium]